MAGTMLVSRAARRCPILPAVSGPRWSERWSDHGNGRSVGGSGAVAGTTAGHPEWRPLEPAAFAQSPGPPRVSRDGAAACHPRKAVRVVLGCRGRPEKRVALVPFQATPARRPADDDADRRRPQAGLDRSKLSDVDAQTVARPRRRRWLSLHQANFGRYWLCSGATFSRAFRSMGLHRSKTGSPASGTASVSCANSFSNGLAPSCRRRAMIVSKSCENASKSRRSTKRFTSNLFARCSDVVFMRRPSARSMHR